MQQEIERRVPRHSIDWDGPSTWSNSARRIVIGWVVFEGVAMAISFAFVFHIGRTVGFDITNSQFSSWRRTDTRYLKLIAGFGGQLQTYTDVQVNGLYFLLITHESPRVLVLAHRILAVANGLGRGHRRLALSLKKADCGSGGPTCSPLWS